MLLLLEYSIEGNADDHSQRQLGRYCAGVIVNECRKRGSRVDLLRLRLSYERKKYDDLEGGAWARELQIGKKKVLC